jgi:transcriptional regulator with XRE-family HTH domain
LKSPASPGSAFCGQAHVCWRERLLEAVRASGRTQSTIARDAGVTRATLSRILNGHHRAPGMVTIARIAYAAGTSVGWVLGEEGFDFSPRQVTELEAAIWFLQDTIERMDSAELFQLRRFLDGSTLVAFHFEQRKDAEDEHLWRTMIQNMRREIYRERLAALRRLLPVFRSGRMELAGSGGASAMLYVCTRAGKAIYIGGADAAEANAIVEIVNLVLDLCESEVSDDGRGETAPSSG